MRAQIIIADIEAAAALMELAKELDNPADPMHEQLGDFAASNLILFYDEPNMGLQLNENTNRRACVVLWCGTFKINSTAHPHALRRWTGAA